MAKTSGKAKINIPSSDSNFQFTGKMTLGTPAGETDGSQGICEKSFVMHATDKKRSEKDMTKLSLQTIGERMRKCERAPKQGAILQRKSDVTKGRPRHRSPFVPQFGGP